MRLLTHFDTGFQPRLIEAIYRAAPWRSIRRASSSFQSIFMSSPNVSVRLIESYTYLDLITGEKPDAKRAEQVLRMLLR